MAYFRKIPVVIEAVSIADIIALEHESIPEWVNLAVAEGKLFLYANSVEIHTLEGIMLGNKNDMLIRGVNGELYACKPDVFDKTYESVEGTML